MRLERGSLAEHRSTLRTLRLAGLDDLRRLGVDEATLALQADAFLSSIERRYPDAAVTIMRHGVDAIGSLVTDVADHAVHIIDLGVVPQFRRRGYALACLTGLQDHARQDGKLLTLWVDAANAAAQSLYDRCGFVEQIERSTTTDRFMVWSVEPATQPD